MTPVAIAMFSFALMDAMFGIPEWKGMYDAVIEAMA